MSCNRNSTKASVRAVITGGYSMVASQSANAAGIITGGAKNLAKATLSVAGAFGGTFAGSFAGGSAGLAFGGPAGLILGSGIGSYVGSRAGLTAGKLAGDKLGAVGRRALAQTKTIDPTRLAVVGSGAAVGAALGGLAFSDGGVKGTVVGALAGGVVVGLHADQNRKLRRWLKSEAGKQAVSERQAALKTARERATPGLRGQLGYLKQAARIQSDFERRAAREAGRL